MQSLTDVPGIGETSLELLEAAGFADAASLARAGAVPLARELRRANEILKIAGNTPTHEQVDSWIRTAREMLGEANPESTVEVVMPVNFEKLPHVAAMLANAPCAIPFPGRWLADSKIAVSEIVPGLLLNRFAGDLEVRIEDRLPTAQVIQRSSANQYVQVSEKPQMGRLDIDLSKIRSVQECASEANGIQPVVPARRPARIDGESAINLLTETLPETNAGRNRNSRRYIRGVLHSDPWALRFGALLTLLLYIILPVAFVVSSLLVLSDGDPEKYHWVRPWWVIVPFLVPVVGLFWMIWGFSCSCRICRQKLFIPRKHRKNAKAHRLPLLGYIPPLIFHMLIFNWFRCTHCGTPVRLKK